MKGDFSRLTYRREDDFTRVLKQQGRVDLDADFNELVEILTQLARRRDRDVIGSVAAPARAAGFRPLGVTPSGDDLLVSTGRLYVDGLLVELHDGEHASYLTQPNLPTRPPLDPEDGRVDLVYLDVWERHLTALEAPSIREVALGGPDTTTRVQTVWQLRVRPDVGDAACADDVPGWPPPAGDGTLSVATRAPAGSDDPCLLEPMGGYRGLENRLYRVEVHDGSDDAGGAPGRPTCKWSRDNGSVAFAIDEVVGSNRVRVRQLGPDHLLSLHTGDWVEAGDDATDLAGEPGVLAQVTDLDAAQRLVTLSRSVEGVDTARHARLRRWDQESDAIEITPGATVTLEHGIEVTFGGGRYQSGDAWTFAARTATGDVERLVDAPPQEVRHRYVALARVTWRARPDGTWTADIRCDEGPTFSSLSDLRAVDVGFDNGSCDLSGAGTVQGAIDALCARTDLKDHNRHLHGWGIVCGLTVACDGGAPERASVTVREGYAIDCEGNDLRPDRTTLDAVAAARRLGLLDEERADADLSLILERGAGERDAAFRFVPYAEGRGSRDTLRGTMLFEVYDRCVRPVIDFVREQLTPSDGGETGAAARAAAVTNLLAQPVNPAAGRTIFISRREHDLMRTFYDDLRRLLRSETFCAMFDDARPFPDLDALGLEALDMDTIFGRSGHTRLRLRPRSREVYTVGPGLNPLRPSSVINRFDLEERRLVAQIDPLAGAELERGSGDTGAGAVQDVAFSPDGRHVYAVVPTRNDGNTLFRVGTIDAERIRWQPVSTICDVKLVTLATTPADPNAVYAIGLKRVVVEDAEGGRRTEMRGAGLYRIDPRAIDPNVQPLVAFNAVGHLVISDDGRAFATAAAPGTVPTSYQHVVGVRVPDGEPAFRTGRQIDLGASGRDDIAIDVRREGRAQQVLYSVVGPERGLKRILTHDLQTGAPLESTITVSDTAIRLAPYHPSGMLLMTLEDGYRLGMIDMDRRAVVDGYHLPMQVGPIAVAADGPAGRAYVLNYASGTIVTVADELLQPRFRFDLQALCEYRKGALEAVADLLAGFLQYLKDCLCDRLLVDCPSCDGEERLYLASVAIRGHRVHRVCNFSQRRYVKSFPTVGSWLSLVPIVPLLDRWVEQFCCSVLPAMFRYDAPDCATEPERATPRLRLELVRNALGFATAQDVGASLRDVTRRGGVIGRVGGDALRDGIGGRLPLSFRPSALSAPRIVDEPVERVQEELEARHVNVERQPYDPARSPRLVADLAGLFRDPAPGSRVTLYEERGQVRYYSVEPAAPDERSLRAMRAELDRQRGDLAEMQGMRQRLSELQATLTRRDEELGELRGRLTDLAERQQAREAEPAAQRVAELERELEGLKRFRSDVERFMRGRQG
jgi:hypothetical protein